MLNLDMNQKNATTRKFLMNLDFTVILYCH